VSHLTTLKTELRNLHSLMAALGRLGYTCQVDGRIVDYFGNEQQVDLVVEVPGQRAVGFVRNRASGVLDLVGDWWHAKLTQQEFLDGIKCNYAREQVLESLQNQGVDLSTVREVEEEDGTILFEVPIDDNQLRAMTAGG